MIAQSEPLVQSRVADIFARRLHAAGCRHAFGIPGGDVLVVMDALERAGIRLVLTKHELKAELDAALERNGFTVIACETARGANDGAS